MIYFIASPTANSVKIGFTRHDARARLRVMAPHSPVPLELVAVVEGDVYLEAVIHDKFDHLRLHNEWFRLEGDLRALVRRVIVDGPSALTDFLGVPASGPRHGTFHAYVTRQCRCVECRAMWRDYQKSRRAGGAGRWRPGGRGSPPKHTRNK